MTEKSCDICDSDSCSAKERGQDETADAFLERQALARRMCQIGHKVLVLSGKGGVGKSTVAVNLAFSLANAGKRVGLLDIDIHGPSIPRLLGLGPSAIQGGNDAMRPVEYNDRLKVMSIGFLLPEPDAAVIWRGPLKMSIIKQFLKDVDWGELDYLLIDSPPGTGDEPLSICQLIPDADGAIIVTTPQEIALADVRKSISFCRTVADADPWSNREYVRLCLSEVRRGDGHIQVGRRRADGTRDGRGLSRIHPHRRSRSPGQ